MLWVKRKEIGEIRKDGLIEMAHYQTEIKLENGLTIITQASNLEDINYSYKIGDIFKYDYYIDLPHSNRRFVNVMEHVEVESKIVSVSYYEI